MKFTKIVVNGREYQSVEQMPPDVREKYLQAVGALRDADGDGVPDVLQKSGPANVVVKESIVYNGKEYKSRDELPPDVRELLDHMPKPKPGENGTRVELKTTEVFRPQMSISEGWMSDGELQPASARSGFPWLLVTWLVVIVVILLLLWLSGIRPADLLRW